MSKQYSITHPLTKKQLSCSRDIYNLVEQGRVARAKVESEVNQINKALSTKYYKGESEDVKIAVKFREDGSINTDDLPQLALEGELGNLDPETKAIVQKALFQFMGSISGALINKTKEAEDRVKDLLNSGTKSPKENKPAA